MNLRAYKLHFVILRAYISVNLHVHLKFQDIFKKFCYMRQIIFDSEQREEADKKNAWLKIFYVFSSQPTRFAAASNWHGPNRRVRRNRK